MNRRRSIRAKGFFHFHHGDRCSPPDGGWVPCSGLHRGAFDARRRVRGGSDNTGTAVFASKRREAPIKAGSCPCSSLPCSPTQYWSSPASLATHPCEEVSSGCAPPDRWVDCAWRSGLSPMRHGRGCLLRSLRSALVVRVGRTGVTSSCRTLGLPVLQRGHD